MVTIGIYDSGIGGLTTAKVILNKFAGNDLYYLSDNAHHPFGNTDEQTLKKVVADGIKRVRAHSDVVVLACNTASSITDDSDVIKLLPPIKENESDAQDTLVMATARTLNKLSVSSEFKVANTPELATLIEIQASLGSARNSINMDELIPYLTERLYQFIGVEQVILGCSHYLYCKRQICEILGNVMFADGNENLCRELSKHASHNPLYAAKITFDFTSQREDKKYKQILHLLLNE